MKHTAHLANLPIQSLKGVGAALSEKLAKLSIHSVQDILFHLPGRYQDRTRITAIRDIRHGDYAVVEGKVISSQVKFGKRRQLVVHLTDDSGILELRFFYFTMVQKESFKPDARVRCFGEVRSFQNAYTMIHPEYRIIKIAAPLEVEENLTPIYPTIEGLHQSRWLQLTQQALQMLKNESIVAEYLPEPILQKFSWLPLANALQYVHRPPPDASVNLLMEGKHPAQQRLSFEELLAHHLSLKKLRMQFQQHEAPALKIDQNITEKFINQLGFFLTGAQEQVWQEISHDIAESKPMLRLVQGDVGCGKTVIAALAAFVAVQAGYQVAVMAPTELLAEQHYQQFKHWFTSFDIRIAWLAGNISAKQRRSTLENFLLGLDNVVIGTHALFQKGVEFKNLGLIIIDEQHRFGVQQRLALREKGSAVTGLYPHQLIMTATPIPRTITMVDYADLDISVIDELPPGRTPVTTILINNQRRHEIIERVKKLCLEGGQVYWVCPLIEESEVMQCEAAEKTVANLREQLPELVIALIHGRLDGKEKVEVMSTFKAGVTQLLVATTVIEVGVNVPNATLMIIENAERLGLAQLHQLRGRVGRGRKQSFCVLLYQNPLSELAKQRLNIMRETNDGFIIAQKDLEIRGPGEMLGTRQSGTQQYRIANYWRDKELLPKVTEIANWLQKHASGSIEPIIQRWIGEGEKFVNA